MPFVTFLSSKWLDNAAHLGNMRAASQPEIEMDSRLYWPPHQPGQIARHHGLLRHHDGTYWECWCDDCNSWRRATWWTHRSEPSIQAEIAYERTCQRRALRYCLTHRDAYFAAAIDGPSHLCRYKRVFIVTSPLRKRLKWAAQRLWRWLSTISELTPSHRTPRS